MPDFTRFLKYSRSSLQRVSALSEDTYNELRCWSRLLVRQLRRESPLTVAMPFTPSQLEDSLSVADVSVVEHTKTDGVNTIPKLPSRQLSTLCNVVMLLPSQKFSSFGLSALSWPAFGLVKFTSREAASMHVMKITYYTNTRTPPR